jgi:hypothetical protein
VLASAPSNEEVQACVTLGSRVARGKSFVDQLVGGSIQTKAMEKLNGRDSEPEKKRIAERKERIKRAARYLDSAWTRNITEAQWVEYFDQSFEIGEMEAVQALAQKMGDAF